MHGTTTEDPEEFKKRFSFRSSYVGHVGVERECFIVDNNGVIVPKAPEVLKALRKYDTGRRFGYELSASQVEGHAGPCTIENLETELSSGDSILKCALDELGLRVSYDEVAPETMPLDVFPDPTGRYAAIASRMSRDALLAACRVIGTHVHVGMPDHETALAVYNRVIAHCDELSLLGDNSHGKRLSIYRVVKKDCQPRPYAGWPDFHRRAVKEGFDVDLRNCWSLIRISKFGTIEARMFGATSSLPKVVNWTRTFHSLCMAAMA